MKYRVIFAARVVAYALAAMLAVGAPHSAAQQDAPKAQPKAKPKAAPAPTTQPKQGGQPELTYSFWTKICQKAPEENAKQVCFIGRDGHMEEGESVVVVMRVAQDTGAGREV